MDEGISVNDMKTVESEEDVSVTETNLLDEKAEIVRGFLLEREIMERAHSEQIEEMNLNFEAEKENLFESFEYEKEEMRKDFEKDIEKVRREFQEEKHVLKLSFDEEKAELVRSFEREMEDIKDAFAKEKSDMRESFEFKQGERDEAFKIEKAEIEARIRREIDRIREVENELKQTLVKSLGDLEGVYAEENNYLEEVCDHEQTEADMHFKSLIEAGLDCNKDEVLKALQNERNQMFSYLSRRQSDVEREFAVEIIEMEQRFKSQKSDIMDIFKKEKIALEQKFAKEKEDIKNKMETEFRRSLQQEKLKFDTTTEGYEHDIAILKYQKEQLEKCFTLEMDKMALRMERDRLDWEKRVLREKRDLKLNVKEQYEKRLSEDRARLQWLLQQFVITPSFSEECLNN